MDALELRRMRQRLGMTQVALAIAVGVYPTTVSRWERGSRRIPEPVAKLMHRIRAERRSKKRR